MRIGIDLGGTKIEAVALARDGGEVARRRVPTPREDYDATVAAVAGLVHELEAEAKGTGTVGVGHPGAISPATGLVKNANSTWLNGRPLSVDLERALSRPVRLANDANCFALSEAVDGAGAGAGVVFGVIVGTGTGGGIVVDGRVLAGRHAIAGEWGHDPLPWPAAGEVPGPPCWCGRRGCVETWLSGPALARDHRERTGEELDAAAVARAALAGDAGARESLARHADRMARALAAVVNLLDPDVIVLGGGLSDLPGIYASVPPILARYVFSDRADTPVLPPRHGPSSGVRGAARLWE
jgi:fructokinase